MDSSVFKIKNGLGLGSDISDVIEAYGDNYTASNKEEEFYTEFNILWYGVESDGGMFCFEDGKLTSIQISGYEDK